MSDNKLSQLRSAHGKSGLATVLGIPLRQLTRAIYGIPVSQKYTVFTIPKSLGGHRTIHAPHREIKFVQKALSNLLQTCLKEIEQQKGVKKPVSHGFHPGRSIFSNAWPHRNKKYVMNFDIEGFFPSIHFGRVSSYFEKNRNFLLNPRVANLIANLSCHSHEEGGTFLPQGSPCSPIISNLIAGSLDLKLRKFANTNSCRYSRYADDITFSTNCQYFPSTIALFDSMTTKKWIAGEGITSVITSSGFRLNNDKTHMSIAGNRQTVTGLVVNKQVSVDRTTYKWVRAASEHMFKRGVAFRHAPRTANVHTTARTVTLAHLVGQANHICYARRKSGVKLLSFREMVGPELLFRRLTYYERFFAHKRTLIICEGETDNIYLKIALKKLGNLYNNLKEDVDGASPIQLLRVTPHITRYTSLNGGSDQQKAFLQNYDEDMKIVGNRWSEKPVILLGDNDHGANAIMQILRGKAVIAGDIKMSTFTHYIRNLYVVLTPVSSNNNNTMIEDFLDHKAKEVLLKGKKFHPTTKGFNEVKHFGKKALAEHVRENADKYDFSGLIRILERINLSIEDYNGRFTRSKI